jgi:phosphoribosylanthranilate isomerase
MRAFRLGAEDLGLLVAYLDRCRVLNCLPMCILVDAWRSGQYGGTGELADWGQLARCRRELTEMPLVLAGGLTAENVTEAIEAVQPDAVDTASGVESAPGLKDSAKVEAFVAAARRAFDC